MARETLYHGSNHEFSPGDPVLPSGPGRLANFGVSSDDRIYMTTRPHEAARYGQHVYEVRPAGRTKPGFYFPEHERTAPHGTVIQRLNPQQFGEVS